MALKSALDFIVIGAQKAGTTTLFELLRRHPDLSLPAGKEAPFFSQDDEWQRGWDRYVTRRFSGVSTQKAWGTVTPQYMAGALWYGSVAGSHAEPSECIIPRRIFTLAPKAKLICILRDPVERAVSHYRMASLNGGDRRGIDEAMQSALIPTTLRHDRETPSGASYVALGEYGRILTPYFEIFPSEQLLVCFTQELETDPRHLLRRILKFIGADDDWVPATLGARYREASDRRRIKRADPHAARRAVSARPLARASWHRLPEPWRVRTSVAYDRLAYQVELRNRVTTAPSPVSEAVEAALRAHFFPDRELLSGLLNRQVPW
jgi:hypothetical protein